MAADSRSDCSLRHVQHEKESSKRTNMLAFFYVYINLQFLTDMFFWIKNIFISFVLNEKKNSVLAFFLCLYTGYVVFFINKYL